MESEKYKIVVASDVNKRDGIGIEVHQNNKIILEIFRDDADKIRTITLYKNDIPLSLVEEAIATFKKEIPWNFL